MNYGEIKTLQNSVVVKALYSDSAACSLPAPWITSKDVDSGFQSCWNKDLLKQYCVGLVYTYAWMKMTQQTLLIILDSKQLCSLIQNKSEMKSGAWHTELLKWARKTQNRFPAMSKHTRRHNPTYALWHLHEKPQILYEPYNFKTYSLKVWLEASMKLHGMGNITVLASKLIPVVWWKTVKENQYLMISRPTVAFLLLVCKND